MGGLIAGQLLAHSSGRLGAVVIGGVGGNRLRGFPRAAGVAEALESGFADPTHNAIERAFRAFAEAGKNDLLALAAIMRAKALRLDISKLGAVANPVLVVVGGDDTLVKEPEALAGAIPGAQLCVIPGRDHIRVVGDRRYREAVLRFLSEHPLPG